MFRNYSSPYGNNNGGSAYPARDEFDTRDNLTAQRNSAGARRNSNLDMQPQSRRITKVMNCMNIAFFILLICGAALTAVITLIKSDGESTTIMPKSTKLWNANETTIHMETSTEIMSTESAANVTVDATTSGAGITTGEAAKSPTTTTEEAANPTTTTEEAANPTTTTEEAANPTTTTEEAAKSPTTTGQDKP